MANGSRDKGMEDTYTAELVSRFGSNIKIKLSNNSDSNVYLFSTYFEGIVPECEYFCRYDTVTRGKKISFLPIPPHLRPYNDPQHWIYIGACGGVLKKMQFKTITIPPNKSITIKISKKALNHNKCYEDINMKSINTWDTVQLNESKNEILNSELRIEFAIYKNIDLISFKSMIDEQFHYNRQICTYDIVSLTIVDEKK